LGENLPVLLKYSSLEDILRWSPLDIPAGVFRDYLYQKSLYPSTIAATKEDLAISQSIARQALYLAMQSAKRDFPAQIAKISPQLTPLFELILAGGAALAGDASRPGFGLLLLLDSIQPVGITTVILDQNNLLPLLGAAASQNNILPVQVLESGAFLSVGTVIAPVTYTKKFGAHLLSAKLVYENKTEAKIDLKYGELAVLPLGNGEVGKLIIQSVRGCDVGFGSNRGGTINISGGALGAIFDGRGRPIDLPADAGRRREMIKKWNRVLGVEQ
jgi:hypothetical protein